MNLLLLYFLISSSNGAPSSFRDPRGLADTINFINIPANFIAAEVAEAFDSFNNVMSDGANDTTAANIADFIKKLAENSMMEIEENLEAEKILETTVTNATFETTSTTT